MKCDELADIAFLLVTAIIAFGSLALSGYIIKDRWRENRG